MFVWEFSVCREVVVMVVVMGAYFNKYIILLCYSYYFIVLKTKIKPLMLDVL